MSFAFSYCSDSSHSEVVSCWRNPYSFDRNSIRLTTFLLLCLSSPLRGSYVTQGEWDGWPPRCPRSLSNYTQLWSSWSSGFLSGSESIIYFYSKWNAANLDYRWYQSCWFDCLSSLVAINHNFLICLSTLSCSSSSLVSSEIRSPSKKPLLACSLRCLVPQDWNW